MQHRALGLAVVGLALASCSSIAGSTSQPPVFDGGTPDVPVPVDVPPAVDVPPSECPSGCPDGRPICLHGGTCVGVTDVATSSDATCALLTDTTVWCWGSNLYGDLGDGTSTARQTPAPVPGLRGVARVTASFGSMFAVMIDGTVRRWGGMPTSGGLEPAPTPVVIEGFASVRSLSAGDHAICAVLTDGTVSCIGRNGGGQIDRNHPQEWVSSPVTVAGLHDIVEVSAREEAPCALDAHGAVWFRSIVGTQGEDTNGATQVADVADGVALATSGYEYNRQTCVAVRGGPLRCGGLVSTGGAPYSPRMAEVPGVSDVVQLDAFDAPCAVLRDTSVWCAQPPFTGTLSGVAQISLSVQSGCARMLDGSLRCWQSGEGGPGAPTPVAW